MTRGVAWLVLACALAWAEPAAAQATATFLQVNTNTTPTSTTFTFTGQSFGTAAADRNIIMTIAGRGTGATSVAVTAVIIGGITATHVRQQLTTGSNANVSALVIAPVPTGTSGTITVSFSRAMLRCTVGAYRAVGLEGVVAYATNASSATDPTATLTIPANGFAIGTGISAATAASVTWTGLTASYNFRDVASVVDNVGAYDAFGTTQTNRTITIDFASSLEPAGVFASWGPVGTSPPVNTTTTHWVTEAGSGSSNCPQVDPCSLTRAVALVNNGTIAGGSIILVQHATTGIYDQALLTIVGNGAFGNYIKFIGENGVRLVGTRTKPTGWTLTSGRTYTYEVAWDEVANYTANRAAQRPETSTWQPIVITDGSSFSLTEPPLYTAFTSIADVEARHCSVWNDTTANKVYVHMCHDGPPVTADELYLTSYQRGAVIIEGDGIWLENLRFEHVSSAIYVDPRANGTVLKDITSLAGQVWIEGTNSLADGLTISEVISQGPVGSPNCIDSNPTFGVGECWQEAGDGRALLIGRQDDIGGNQLVRNARISRSWNGGRIDGQNTIELSWFWGFPNHTFEATGQDVTIRDSVFANGQDSIYSANVTGVQVMDNLTVEHNIIGNGFLHWVSVNDACPTGCDVPAAWRFRYNIIGAELLDEFSYQTLTSDCNAWMPKSASPAHMLRITHTGATADIGTWLTLANIQANTTFDDNSLEFAYTKWTDGSVFVNFTGNANIAIEDWDVTLVNPTAFTACGVVAGPNITAEVPDVVTITRMRLNIKGKA